MLSLADINASVFSRNSADLSRWTHDPASGNVSNVALGRISTLATASYTSRWGAVNRPRTGHVRVISLQYLTV